MFINVEHFHTKIHYIISPNIFFTRQPRIITYSVLVFRKPGRDGVYETSRADYLSAVNMEGSRTGEESIDFPDIRAILPARRNFAGIFW